MDNLIKMSINLMLFAIKAHRHTVRSKMREIIDSHEPGPNFHEKPGAYQFYVDRLMMVPNYGLVAGSDMVKLICRCAFNDDCLTDMEAIAIINICHDPRVHNLLMEVNFNEGWQ